MSANTPVNRLVAVNGSGGAFVSILASIPCRRMEIIEDDSVTAQGLDYQLPNDNFATTFDVTAAHEPIVLGNVVAAGHGAGPVLGYPAQRTAGESIAADTVIKLRSKTVTATTVRVTEYP